MNAHAPIQGTGVAEGFNEHDSDVNPTLCP